MTAATGWIRINADWFPLGQAIPVDPTPGGDGKGVVLDCDLHAALTHGAEIPDMQAALTTMGPYSYFVVPAWMFDRVRICVDVISPLPSGAYATVQWIPFDNATPDEADWQPMVDTGTLQVPVDAATQVPLRSATMDLALAARTDITIRGAIVGGNGTTILRVRKVQVQFLGGLVPPTEPPTPLPPTETQPCNRGGFSAAGLTDMAHFASLGWSLVDNGIAIASPPALVTDPSDGVTRAILLDVAVPGSFGTTGWYYFTNTFPGPFNSANTYYTEAVFRREEVTAGVGDLSGFVMEGQGNVHIWHNEGESGYVTSVGQTIAGADASKYLRFGYFDIVNGEQNHHERIYLKSLRIVEVACIETVVPEDDSGTGGNGPPDPDPGDEGSPPPPSSSERGLLLWAYQPRWFYRYAPFNGVVDTAPTRSPAGLIAYLNLLQAAGMKVLLNVVLRSLAKVGGKLGVFSQGLWIDQVNLYDGVDISPYFPGTVVGIEVMDEPHLATREGWGMVVQQSVVDLVLAKRCSEIFPGIPLYERVNATRLEASGHNFQYITGCYNAFQGVRTPSQPTISTFMVNEIAAQARLGLSRRIWGLNSRTNVGASLPTAAQFRAWGTTFGQDKASSGIALWAGSTAAGPNEVPTTQGYIDAWQDVLDEINRP